MQKKEKAKRADTLRTYSNSKAMRRTITKTRKPRRLGVETCRPRIGSMASERETITMERCSSKREATRGHEQETLQPRTTACGKPHTCTSWASTAQSISRRSRGDSTYNYGMVQRRKSGRGGACWKEGGAPARRHVADLTHAQAGPIPRKATRGPLPQRRLAQRRDPAAHRGAPSGRPPRCLTPSGRGA